MPYNDAEGYVPETEDDKDKENAANFAAMNPKTAPASGGLGGGQKPKDQAGNALKGAASGAMAGSSLGPWGTAGGAVIGGLSGYFSKDGGRIGYATDGRGAIAAALTTARRARADGGKVHSGAIKSPVAGRTDHLNMHVPSGAYVIPADIISAMGEGNTLAGFRVAKSIFGQKFYGSQGLPGEANPYAQSAAPYGTGKGQPYVEAPEPYDADAPETVPQRKIAFSSSLPRIKADTPEPRAAGGETDAVPIVAAGGEYVIHPTDVQKVGKGSLDDGHRILDQFVKQMRAKTIKTLEALPGPKRD